MNPQSPVIHETPISTDRYYSIIRGQIEHEDDLLGQRLSWFVGAQAFLFTAYAITLSNSGPSHVQWVVDRMHLLLILIPVTAILSCILIYMTVIAGLVAIADLRRLYRAHTEQAQTIGLPPVQGYRRTQLLGQAAPLFVPIVFLVVWTIVLVQ